jgi:hypothetical protein
MLAVGGGNVLQHGRKALPAAPAFPSPQGTDKGIGMLKNPQDGRDYIHNAFRLAEDAGNIEAARELWGLTAPRSPEAPAPEPPARNGNPYRQLAERLLSAIIVAAELVGLAEEEDRSAKEIINAWEQARIDFLKWFVRNDIESGCHRLAAEVGVEFADMAKVENWLCDAQQVFNTPLFPWQRGSAHPVWALATDTHRALALMADFVDGRRAGTMSKTRSGAAAPQPLLDDNEPEPIHPTLFKQGSWDLSEAGVATYKTTRMPLENTNRDLLARLIRGGGKAVHYIALARACGNDQLDYETMRGHVCRLRAHLREHLKRRKDYDPIPYHDPESYALALL